MRVPAVALLLLATAVLAHQPSFLYVAPEEPDGSVLAVWEDGVETLVVDSGCLITLPSEPEIEASTPGLFPSLRHLTRPKLLRTWQAENLRTVSLFVAAGAIGLIVAGRKWRSLARRAAIASVLLTAWTVAEAGDGGEAGFREYAVERGADAVARLRARGFLVPAHAEAAVGSALARGEYAVAYRPVPSDRPWEAPRPLVFRFAAPAPVLRLPFHATPEPRALHVYAEGAHAVVGSHPEFSDAMHNGHPELIRLLGGQRWVTRSSFESAGGTAAWRTCDRHSEWRISPRARASFDRSIAVGGALLSFVLWIALLPVRPVPHVLGAVVLPVVVALLAWGWLNTIPVVEPVVVEWRSTLGTDAHRSERLRELLRSSDGSLEGLRAAAAADGLVECDAPGGFTLRQGLRGPELHEYAYVHVLELGGLPLRDD